MLWSHREALIIQCPCQKSQKHSMTCHVAAYSGTSIAVSSREILMCLTNNALILWETFNTKNNCPDRISPEGCMLWSHREALIMPWIKNIQWHVCHVSIPSKKARFQISVMHGLHPPGHYAIKCQPPDTYAPMVPRTCTPVTYLMHSSFVCSTCLLAPLHPLGA